MASPLRDIDDPAKEDSLSDASLIEDEKMDETSSQASSIHLSGEAVTGSPARTPAQHQVGEDQASFQGFTPKEISDAALKISLRKRLIDSKDEEFLNSCNIMESVAATVTKQPSKERDKEKGKEKDKEKDKDKVKDKDKSEDKDKGKAPSKPPQVATPKALPAPMARESRGWKPSGQFFKPLTSGWKREVIYGRESDGTYTAKPSQIIYHAPPQHGCKPRSFQSLADLGHFLSSATGPTLTLHNFSFRKEPMNASKDQEICHASDEDVKMFPDPPPPPKHPFSHHPQPDPDSKSQPSGGKIKLKMFSKMKEKNTINKPRSPSTESPVVAKHSNLPASTVKPQTASKRLSAPPPVAAVSAAASTISSAASMMKSNAVLRPNNMDKEIVCSIHCRAGSGPPALSCFNCHTMFHPVCVGLMDGLDYNRFDFYCAKCRPPPGKESVEMPPPVPKPTASKISAPYPIPSLTQRIAPSPPVSQGFNGHKRKAAARSSVPARKTLRPIESQAVINIAGTKYLVVPHPLPSAAKKPKRSNENVLPLLLRPLDGGSDHPSFEIEESHDGKMILLPIGGHGAEKKIAKKKKLPDVSAGGRLGLNVADGYEAMLRVFGFLSPAELLNAGLVCKMWYELAHHHSLWTTFKLKGCKVKDWPGFARHLNRVRTSKLDARRIVHPDGGKPEETWEQLKKVAPALHSVKRIEMPKISAGLLNEIVEGIESSPIASLEAVSATSLTCKGSGDALDLTVMGNVRGLAELKLKASSGHLSVRNLGDGLETLPSTLTKLSLLSFNDIKAQHLDLIVKLSHLTVLELGDCRFISHAVFGKLISLKSLRQLRLEKGTVGRDVGALEHVGKLQQLELVDMELQPGFGEGFVKLRKLKKLLLIPLYKDEVAAINSEVVDSALSMSGLTHFILGLTNEWLEMMSTLLDKNRKSTKRDNFPIMVNGVCEMFSLPKLFKTLTAALPSAHVKILKMPAAATTKQSVNR